MLLVNSDEVLTVVNTHRGFGYQEKTVNPSTTTTVTEVKPTINFIQGETLVPMVVPAAPLTLKEKISMLEEKFTKLVEDEPSSEAVKLFAQFEVLKDAWNKKKLEVDYLEEWVDATLSKLTEEKESPATTPPGEDQVIDMILEDSGSEEPQSPSATEATPVAVVGAELDSALDSFYSDLANLEAPIDVVDHPVEVTTEKPVDPPISTSIPPTIEPTIVEEESATVNNDPAVNKGIKRSKMSSDMTSLVAKWQKINQSKP